MVPWWFAVVLSTCVQIITLVSVEFGAIRPLLRRQRQRRPEVFGPLADLYALTREDAEAIRAYDRCVAAYRALWDEAPERPVQWHASLDEPFMPRTRAWLIRPNK